MSATSASVCASKTLMPPGIVVLRRDERAVLRDRAADAVAGLLHTRLDAARQQVDLGQRAVAAEHVGVRAVARVDHRGVRQVAEAGDGAQRLLRCSCRRRSACRRRARRRRRGRRCRIAAGATAGAAAHPASSAAAATIRRSERRAIIVCPRFLGEACHAVAVRSTCASSSLSIDFQAGIGVPGPPVQRGRDQGLDRRRSSAAR